MPKNRIPTLDDFCTFFEAVPEGVVGIDNEGCIVVLNIRMASMFGFNREELIGKPIETLVPRRFRAGHSGFRQAFALFPRNRPMGVGRDFFGQRQRRQRVSGGDSPQSPNGHSRQLDLGDRDRHFGA